MASLKFSAEGGASGSYDRLIDAKAQILHGTPDAPGETRLLPVMQFTLRLPFETGSSLAKWALAPASKGRFAKVTLNLMDRTAGETHTWELQKAYVHRLEEVEFPADPHNATAQENIILLVIRGVIANGEDYDGENALTMTSANSNAPASPMPLPDASDTPTPLVRQVAPGVLPSVPIFDSTQTDQIINQTPIPITTALPLSASDLKKRPREISQEQYDELRDDTPDKKLRRKINESFVEDMDDVALPGLKVRDGLAADHIVPMDTIVRMPGFGALSYEKQLMALNYPANFVGISKSANSSKGAKSYAEWTEHKGLKIKVSPKFREEMMLKEQQLIPKLQEYIQQLSEH